MKLILKNCSIEFARSYTIQPVTTQDGFYSMDGVVYGNDTYGKVLTYDVSSYNMVKLEMPIPASISGNNRGTIWTTLRNGVRQSLYSFLEGDTGVTSISMEIDTSTCDKLVVNQWAGLAEPKVDYIYDNSQYMLVEGVITQGYYNASMEFKENASFNCGTFDVSQYDSVIIIASGQNSNGISMYIGKAGDSVIMREILFSPDAQNQRTTSLVVDTRAVDTLIVQSVVTIPTVKVKL